MYAILLCLPAFFKEKPLLLVFAAMSEEFLSLLELNRLFKQNSFFPLLSMIGQTRQTLHMERFKISDFQEYFSDFFY